MTMIMAAVTATMTATGATRRTRARKKPRSASSSGPYYAAEVRSGALGTKSSPQTDSMAQVRDLDLKPIDGLYAAGNVMASMIGMTYGGGGGTLGPGMVFGYLAGKHAAQRNATATAERAAPQLA